LKKEGGSNRLKGMRGRRRKQLIKEMNGKDWKIEKGKD